MSRFYIPRERIKGNVAHITGKEAHHILNVLRLKKGDRIEAFDGRGWLLQGRILDTTGKKVRIKLEGVVKDTQKSNLKITLIQALPKRNKMDYIVEKSTELGVDVIIPAQTARTIVKLDKAGQLTKKRRWQSLALEASKQCGRATVPEVKDLARWPDVLSNLGDFDLKLLACLNEETVRLKDVLCSGSRKRLALFIGPEGDFTPEEVSQAQAAGCVAVSLGPNILKSDTAAVCALAMINYEFS